MMSTIQKILELPNLPQQIKTVFEQFIVDFKSQDSTIWNNYVKTTSEDELRNLIKSNPYINEGLNLRFKCRAVEIGLTGSEIVVIYNYVIFPFNFYCNYILYTKLFKIGFHDKILNMKNPIFIDYGSKNMANSCSFSLAIKKANFKKISKNILLPKINQEGWILEHFDNQYSDYLLLNRCFYIGKEMNNSLPFKFIEDNLITDKSRSSIFNNWISSENIINGKIFNEWVPHRDINPMVDTFEFENIVPNIQNYIENKTKVRGDYRLKDSTSDNHDDYTFNELCKNLIGNNVYSEYSIVISLSFSLNEITIIKDGWFSYTSAANTTTKEYAKFSEFQEFVNFLNEICTKFKDYNILLIITDFKTDDLNSKIEHIKEKTFFEEVINGNIEQSIVDKKTIYSIFYKDKKTNIDVSELIWERQSKVIPINDNIIFSDTIKSISSDLFTGYYLAKHTIKSTLNIDGSYDTERTEIGEMLYQLKYCFDKSKIDTISELASKIILNTFEDINILIPIPPSNLNRPFQPVLELTQRISELTGIPTNLQYLKKKSTPALKSIDDLQERKDILANAFSVIDNRFKGKTVLLFDDLYRSGETLNAAAKVLREQGEVDKIYVLTLTKTRTKK